MQIVETHARTFVQKSSAFVFAVENENDLYAEFILSFLLREIVFICFFLNGFCNIDIDWVQMLNGTNWNLYDVSKNHETSSENFVLR